MKIKTILILAIVIIFLAGLIVGAVFMTRYITDSVGDPSRFSFIGITANGVKLGADEAETSKADDHQVTAIGGRIAGYSVLALEENGLDMWVEWINRARDLSIEDARTIDEIRLFLKGPGKKTWYDKENGVRCETYRDTMNYITIKFYYNNADGTLLWFSAEQEQ